MRKRKSFSLLQDKSKTSKRMLFLIIVNIITFTNYSICIKNLMTTVFLMSVLLTCLCECGKIFMRKHVYEYEACVCVNAYCSHTIYVLIGHSSYTALKP